MKPSRMILFNGPMDCGKDRALEELFEKGFLIEKRECKDRLHELVISTFNLEQRQYWPRYNDKVLKNVPWDSLRVSREAFIELNKVPGMQVDLSREPTLSIREALIYVSEVMFKPLFGKEYFGQYRANQLETHEELYADASCAFVDELTPLVKKFGQENILLMRIHRPGHEFGENDSRGWIPDGVIDNIVDIQNDSTLEEYLNKVETVVEDFLCK